MRPHAGTGWNTALMLLLLALVPGMPYLARAQGIEGGPSAIIGEMRLEAVVEREAELAVRVRRPDGTPLQGARVFWTVGESTAEARLGRGNPTLSDADGVSTQTVELGEIPGIVVVTAELEPPGRAAPRGRAAERSAVFRIRVGGDR